MSQALSLTNNPIPGKGFTLMEVLIAITVGTMVMGILATALSLSVRAWDKARKPPDTELQDLLDLLSAQIIFINRSPVQYRGGMGPLFIGKKNELSFVTNFSPIGLSMNCPVIVSYRFDESDQTLSYSQMIMPGALPEGSNIVDDFLTKSREAFITVSSVSKLSFGYVEKEGSSRVELWENPTVFPEKVVVEIQSPKLNGILIRSSYLNLFNEGKILSSPGQVNKNVPVKRR